MASRLNTRQSEMTKNHIQTTQLVKRLQEHALGDLELGQSQIRAIEVLLKKTLPDIKSIELTGDPNNPIDIISDINIRLVEPPLDGD